jgi:hypothetical protein
MQGFFKIITTTDTTTFYKMQQLVFLFLLLIIITSCQTAYYIPAYKQLPSYDQTGDINVAVMAQQGYTANGLGAFINGAITEHIYAGYQFNKSFDSNKKSLPFQSQYHEVLCGLYKSSAPQTLMTLDSNFMKAQTIYGIHLGVAYQDWISDVNKPTVFYANKKMTFTKYFMQLSIGSKTRIYEGNYILYGAWYDLQTVNYTIVTPLYTPTVESTPHDAYEAARNEKSKLKKAKSNFIYGISYSGSIIIKDFRIVFNLNSPNSLGSIIKQPYLDFESINLFAGLQYQLSTKRKKTNYNRINQ